MSNSWMDMLDIVLESGAEESNVEIDTVFGKVKILDSWAAGGAWHLVQFLEKNEELPMPEKPVWMFNYGAHLTYFADSNDDGFVFNAPEGRVEDDNEDLVAGGQYLPEFEGFELYLKEGEL